MKQLGGVLAFGLNRITKAARNLTSWLICRNLTVKPGRVVLWAYNFKQYGCNPRYLSDYLLANHPEFEIIWAFRNKVDTRHVDKRVKTVRFRSMEYLKAMATAEFLITNSRTDPYHIYWHKRTGQKYLMLWHGGIALKRIELDAKDKIGYIYMRKAMRDSALADLMIAGCRMQAQLFRTAFAYYGEVLECGTPRNDIFFRPDTFATFRQRVTAEYGIPSDNKIVLYAPTFRRSHSIEPYHINWDAVIKELKAKRQTNDVSVIVRLHPNLIGKVDTSSLTEFPNVVDGTKYPDMQELLCASDLLITDYSSSMFDFAMLQRPCILYATDRHEYDRGFYFDISNLPFPLAQNEDELLSAIRHFDMEQYSAKLNAFFTSAIGLFENGHASEAIAQWMLRHRL